MLRPGDDHPILRIVAKHRVEVAAVPSGSAHDEYSRPVALGAIIHDAPLRTGELCYRGPSADLTCGTITTVIALVSHSGLHGVGWSMPCRMHAGRPSESCHSAAANEQPASASFSARKTPHRIPVNTFPDFSRLQPRIYQQLLGLATKDDSDRLLGV